MLKTGLLSITFRKLPAEEIIALASEAGLDGIEWGGDVHVPPGNLDEAARIRRLTESAGLQVIAYGSYYRSEPTADPETDFAPMIRTAVELGAPLVRVWAGTLGSTDLTPEGRANLVRHSRKLADMGKEAGIIVASEYHGGTVTDTPESALRFVREVDHPNYRTLWQPHNGADFETARQSLEDILPWVENVHVFHWWPSAAERHPLATGSDRWTGYLDLLQNSGRDHACLLEFVKGNAPDQFREDAATLKKWIAS